MDKFVKGSTSQTVEIFIQDNGETNGAGLAGLVYNSSGLTAYYVRTRGTATAITLATLAAANSAWSSGGFKEIHATNVPGLYRLDVPDAAFASGADFVDIMLFGHADMAPVLKRVQLTGVDLNNAASLGLSRIDVALSTLATAANLSTLATAVGVIDDFLDTEIASIKAKTDQLTFTLANKVDAGIVSAASLVQAAADKVWSTGTRELTAFGFTVSATVSDKTGFSLSSAGILAIWDKLTSALTAAGSIGKLLVDKIDVVLSTRASQTSVDTIDDFLDTEVAAIKAKTDLLTFTSNDLRVTLDGETVTVGTNSDKTGYALSSAAIDAILDDAPSAELASVPGDTATLRLMIQFMFQYFKFKRTSTATQEKTYKADSSTELGTSTLSDTSGTVTKGKHS